MAMNTLETIRPLSSSIATLVLEQTDEKNIDQKDAQFPIFLGHEIRIGRDASQCSPVIHANIVSKQHFRIYSIVYENEEDTQNPPLIYCEDLESVNGTWVNDTLIGMIGSTKKGFLLGDGDLIQIKPHWAFRFHQNFSDIEIVVDDVQEAEMQHFVDRYTVDHRVLGCGLSGRVHLAYDNFTRTQLACKIVDLRAFKQESMRDEVSPEFVKPPLPRDYNRKSSAAQELSRLLREVDILNKLNHPNIVSLKKAFRSENTLYLFQELATGGDLFSYLQSQGGKLNDLHSRIISRQVALAIQYLHAQGIAHRDLKPENILVTHTEIGHRVLLTDFGSSTLVANTPNRLISIVGTEGYVAPEVTRTQKNGGYYTKAIDMWSLGIVTTCLLTGDLLIPQQEQHQLERESKSNVHSAALLRNINKLLEAKEQWEHVGIRARDFVKRLLVTNAEQRMTANEAVSHYWFTRPKEVAKEMELLYERANKHWSPRQDKNIFEELPEIAMTSENRETDRDAASKPSKRQKRLPDSTASPYYSLDRRLHPKIPSHRKALLAQLKKNPSHMFIQEASFSKQEAHPAVSTIATTEKSKSMRVPGNDLFGQDAQIDPTDPADVEFEPKSQMHVTQVGSHQENLEESNPVGNIETQDVEEELQDQDSITQVLEDPDRRGLQGSEESQDVELDLQDRQPDTHSSEPSEDIQGSEESQDIEPDLQDRQPDTYVSELSENMQDLKESQDGPETLHSGNADTQETQKQNKFRERQQSINYSRTQEDQRVFEEAARKIPLFSSAKLLYQKIAEEKEQP